MNETMFNFHPTKSRKKVKKPKNHLKNATSCTTDTTQDISTAFEEFSSHEHPHDTQKKTVSLPTFCGTSKIAVYPFAPPPKHTDYQKCVMRILIHCLIRALWKIKGHFGYMCLPRKDKKRIHY